MKAAVCFLALCVLAAPALARTGQRSLLQTADAVKEACPNFQQYFGTSSDGLDDCTITQLTEGATGLTPTPACCTAVDAFITASGCNADGVVLSKVATMPGGCTNIASPCATLGPCAT
jgi:hypothetical protein